MTASARLLPRTGRKTKVLLGMLGALILVVALFDWNWLRPALEHYLSSKSGREVRAGHLSVTGLFSLEPTVTFRDAYIQNAPWADTQKPMAVAGEASFTFPLRGIIDDNTVVSKIVLKDAEIDMQKQADGLRNWRLKDPENRGPPRISVLRLEAHRSKLRFLDHHPDRDFDLRFASSEAPPDTPANRGGSALVTRIEASGVYRGARFTGQALTGPWLSFRQTREYFPVRGHVLSGNTRLELDGQAADMFERPMLDAAVRLAGPTLTQLHPFVRMRPAHSRPYRLEGDVKRTGSEYLVTRLRGKIGETDLSGDAWHDLRDGRHHWRANLSSSSADLHDLGTLAGIAYPDKPGAAHPDRLFPQRAIRTERFRAQDVQVRLDAKKVSTPGMAALEGLRFEADLQQGVLQVKGLDITLAGGHATGQAMLDARKDMPHGSTVLKLAGLRLEKLFPKLPPDARKSGPIRGSISLEGTGPSIAGMLGAATGRLDLALHGGSISNRLDAQLTLNLGKLAGLMFKGDRDIPILCAVAGFDFSGGKGKARALLIETEQTRIDGAGALDLRAERQDLILVPKPKKPGLLTLGSSIRVTGSFKHPDIDFNKGGRDAPAIASSAQCPGRPVAMAARTGLQ